MSEEYPEGALIEVTLELRLPKAATESHINEWLGYAVMQRGGIKPDNPLFHEAPEGFGPCDVDWKWDGMIGRKEKIDVQDLPGGGQRYRVRYVRELYREEKATT